MKSARLGDVPVFCPHCGCEIDPDVCHCGDNEAGHRSCETHSFIPMGCACGYHIRPESCLKSRDPVVVDGEYFLVEPTPYNEDGYVRVRAPGSRLILTFERDRVRRFK